MRKQMAAAAVVASLAAALSGCDSRPSASFAKDVQPLLNKHCAECHVPGGEGVANSGFLVGSYTEVMAGTKYGSVIVAGDPLSSSLYRLIAGLADESIQMPHTKSPMPASDMAIIETWITQGAQDN